MKSLKETQLQPGLEPSLMCGSSHVTELSCSGFPPKNAQEMSFSTLVLPPPKLWLLTWVVNEDLREFLIYVLGFGAKILAFPPFFIHGCYFIPQGVSWTW